MSTTFIPFRVYCHLNVMSCRRVSCEATGHHSGFAATSPPDTHMTSYPPVYPTFKDLTHVSLEDTLDPSPRVSVWEFLCGGLGKSGRRNHWNIAEQKQSWKYTYKVGPGSNSTYKGHNPSSQSLRQSIAARNLNQTLDLLVRWLQEKFFTYSPNGGETWWFTMVEHINNHIKRNKSEGM